MYNHIKKATYQKLLDVDIVKSSYVDYLLPFIL